MFENFKIDGFVGLLEVCWVEVVELCCCVVFVYLYLFYGGIMDNVVVCIVESVFLGFGIFVFCFNFCGVG